MRGLDDLVLLAGVGAQPRFDALCQLCSRQVGQVVDGVFVHHPDCERVLRGLGRMPRCCECGGTLYLEASSGQMLSASDLEAARRLRPGIRVGPTSRTP
jgi:hypothetical protein